jgi:type I restriction enzyme S subunit
VNTKQLRQKILDLAIRGKLVPQDPNDEPASVLLERIHAEKERLIKEGKIKRDKKDSDIVRGDDKSHYEQLPDGWVIVTLGDICLNFKYGTSEKSSYVYQGLPVLRIPNIGDGCLIYDDLKFLGNEVKDNYELLKPSDILIVRSNGSRDIVGKCALVGKMDRSYAEFH